MKHSALVIFKKFAASLVMEIVDTLAKNTLVFPLLIHLIQMNFQDFDEIIDESVIDQDIVTSDA